MSELLVLIEGQPTARIQADRHGRLCLKYDSAWLASEHSYPLSLTMPLSEQTYPHKIVWAYLWNLLPENPRVLDRWGQQYHVSAGNPFKLLTHGNRRKRTPLPEDRHKPRYTCRDHRCNAPG